MTTNRQITTLEISPAAPNRSIITGSVPTGHSGYKVSSAKILQVRLNPMAINNPHFNGKNNHHVNRERQISQTLDVMRKIGNRKFYRLSYFIWRVSARCLRPSSHATSLKTGSNYFKQECRRYFLWFRSFHSFGSCAWPHASHTYPSAEIKQTEQTIDVMCKKKRISQIHVAIFLGSLSKNPITIHCTNT